MPGDESPSGARNHYDWETLFAEWISSRLSISEFHKTQKPHIERGHFFKMAKRGKWMERKARVNEKAMKDIEKHVAKQVSSEWKEHEKLWRAVEIHAAHLLRKNVGPDGKLSEAMSPTELASLTTALERALKARKLLIGEATENIAASVKTESVHADVVAMVNERRKAREAAIDVKPEPDE